MNLHLVRQIWFRAADRCEYCHLPASASPAPFQIDHIIARQHGGRTELDNLALCCIHCNRFKGPNIAGIDEDQGKLYVFSIPGEILGYITFAGLVLSWSG